MNFQHYHKHCLLLLICVAAFSFLPSAQTTKQINHKLSEKTVVKDSLGNRYVFQHWQELVMRGDYTIVPERPEEESTEFWLKKLSADEKEKRFSSMPKPAESEAFKTGAKLIPFLATSIDGHRLRLKDLQGKIVVLNFCFIDCPPCRIEIPQLNELVKNYDSSVVFIAVGLDSKTAIQNFLKTMPFDYQIIDDGKTLADRNGIRTYPTHVVVDVNGRVKFHTSGLALNTIYWLKKTINEAILERDSTKEAR